MISAETRGQFVRYALVGLGSNLLLYLAYLLLTSLGVGHKTAMSLIYAVGVAQTFLFNRHWSFRHLGGLQSSFARYLFSYAFGYALNFAVLWLAVDQLGLPHQIVQGVMVFAVALLMFLMQKYWVFASHARSAV